MIKKIKILVFAVILAVCVCACGSEADSQPTGSTISSEQNVSSSNTSNSSAYEANDQNQAVSLNSFEIESIAMSALSTVNHFLEFTSDNVEYEIVEDYGSSAVINLKISIEGAVTDEYVMWPSEYIFTLNISKSSSWCFDSVVDYYCYYDFGYLPFVVKETFDASTYTTEYVIYDTEKGAEKSNHYTFIGYADNYGAMVVANSEGKYGFIYSDGTQITPAVFDDVYDYQFVPGKDAAIVKAGSSWGIINHAGQYVLEASYKSIVPCGEYASVTLPAASSFVSSKTELVDWVGNVLIQPDWGEVFRYYEPGYYLCEDEDGEGMLYDADFGRHDFTEVYEKLGMHYREYSTPKVKIYGHGWNTIKTGGQYVNILDDYMNLVTDYKMLIVSSLTNSERMIGRVDNGASIGKDYMFDKNGNIVMEMPQVTSGPGRLYTYDSTVTSCYAMGHYSGESSTKRFFCVLATGELVVCEKIYRLEDTECLVVKLLNSTLYCVYDRGEKVKEAFYSDYSYDAENSILSLTTSDNQVDTYTVK